MKTKPNYKGWCEEMFIINRYGISIGMSELFELAKKYHTPIPKEIIIKGYCRRDDIIMRLVNLWRYAENSYLKTGEDILKIKVKKIQNRLHLNEHEITLLEKECNNLGV